MKVLLLCLVLALGVAGCKKDHCGTVTTLQGDNSCVQCFRSEEKLYKWQHDNMGKSSVSDIEGCD